MRDIVHDYAPYFASVQAAGTVPIRRGGVTVFDVAVYRATAMRAPYPAPLPP